MFRPTEEPAFTEMIAPGYYLIGDLIQIVNQNNNSRNFEVGTNETES